MKFAQRRNRLTTHFSERFPFVKRRISVYQETKGFPIIIITTYYLYISLYQGFKIR